MSAKRPEPPETLRSERGFCGNPVGNLGDLTAGGHRLAERAQAEEEEGDTKPLAVSGTSHRTGERIAQKLFRGLESPDEWAEAVGIREECPFFEWFLSLRGSPYSAINTMV